MGKTPWVLYDGVMQYASLSGLTALVTGVGRRRGIGFALVQELVKQGVHVAYTYHRAYDQALFPQDLDDPSSFVDVAEHTGVVVRGYPMDLSSADAPAILFARIQEECGMPDYLINNAAYSKTEPFASLSSATLDEHYAVNVRATTLLIQEFLRNRAKPGVVVNMTSGQALGPMPDELAYTMTKASVDMLTMQLAPVCAPHRVRVFAYDPGPTDTGWMTEEIRQHISTHIPPSRINTPQGAAVEVIALLSDTSRKSGTVIHHGI